jgi:cytochrome c-type biogenesis protein CcmH
MAAVLAVALVVGMGSRDEPTRAERARSFAATVKCPTCRSQSVAESDAPLAMAIRAEIDARFEEGQNEEQVRQYLISRFGDEVLLTPPRTGVGSLVWILPVAGLLIALGALAFTFRRWRLEPVGPSASAADRELVATAMGAASGASRARDDVEVVADASGEVDADPHGEGDGR